jgi:hypothetical protein
MWKNRTGYDLYQQNSRPEHPSGFKASSYGGETKASSLPQDFEES